MTSNNAYEEANRIYFILSLGDLRTIINGRTSEFLTAGAELSRNLRNSW